jgi:glycerol-3-phosphate dehydrogenase
VQPLTFLIPFYRGQRTPPWKLKIGLRLYDLLAGGSRIPPHRTYSADELRELEPGLRAEGLRGGASYGDGQVPFVERLCVENALDAAAHGAVVVNHAVAEELTAEAGRVTGALVRDLLTNETVRVRAKRILNVTGPWADRVGGIKGVRQRMTKGIHMVNPRATSQAVLLFSPDDDRVFFSIPWMGLQLVGTTDTDYASDPSEVAADADDVSYLQRGIAFALPEADTGTVHYTYAGIRNLVPEDGKSESAVSRKHQVVDHARAGLAGLTTLVGGKITPYRAVCEHVVDHLRLTRARSDTARAPLPGAPAGDAADLVGELETRLAGMGADARAACTLAHTYGTRAHDLLDRLARDPDARRPVCDHAPMLQGEIAFAIETEMARTAADVLLRRASAGWMACEGLDALPHALDGLDRALGREPAARKADEALYMRELAMRHRYERTA